MTAALSDAYSVEVVDTIRALTGGITDTPTLPADRWEQLVRRAAGADAEIAKAVARVDRRVSLQGLARRLAGEAARADQHPGLREVVDRLVAGNGKAPTNDEIDRAVDAAASWSYRSRQRSQVVQVACDQLPSRLGIVEFRMGVASRLPETDPTVWRWCRSSRSRGGVVTPPPAVMSMPSSSWLEPTGSRWTTGSTPPRSSRWRRTTPPSTRSVA